MSSPLSRWPSQAEACGASSLTLRRAEGGTFAVGVGAFGDGAEALFLEGDPE
jgi:hypothetical protein